MNRRANLPTPSLRSSDLSGDEAELNRLEIRFNTLSREWDEVDGDFTRAYYASNLRYAKMPKALLSRRARLGRERAWAWYGMERQRFLMGERADEPKRPEDDSTPEER